MTSFSKWMTSFLGGKETMRSITVKARGVKRKKIGFGDRPPLVPEQLVLLLDKILDLENITSQTLTQLKNVYDLKLQNTEVRHRWCEVIIKHQYVSGYEEVRRFLIEDQGMGIYLFGELMISQNGRLWKIAHEVFDEIRDEMDRCTYETVLKIIFGE